MNGRIINESLGKEAEGKVRMGRIRGQNSIQKIF